MTDDDRPETPMPRPERSVECAAIEGAARAMEEYLGRLNGSPMLFWSPARKRDIVELLARMPVTLRDLAGYVAHLEVVRPDRRKGFEDAGARCIVENCTFASDPALRREWLAGWRDAQEAAARKTEQLQDMPCAKCGAPRSNHRYRHMFVPSACADIAAAIRAMDPEGEG